jgi:ribosomal protein S5
MESKNHPPSNVKSEEIKKVVSDFKKKNENIEKLSIKEKLNMFADNEKLELKGLGSFDIMVMDRKITTNTTTLRRINSIKVLVYGGNYNGVIGYGKGRGLNGHIAMRKAIESFKQNIVAINLDLLNTFPKGIYAKFGKYEIAMWSKRRFNSWGSVQFANMIQMAGIHHCMFKVCYDEPNPYNLVYCFMKLLTQNTTPKLLAEEKGIKLFDTVWSRRPGPEDSYYGAI